MYFKKGIELGLRITYGDRTYSDFEFTLLGNLHFEGIGPMEFLCDFIPQSYNQEVINIFKDWDNNNPIHWQSLPVKMRNAWLVACLYWSGLPKQLKKDSFVVQGPLVKDEPDFYCLMGEVFFGERGYFGQDLDGLDDCMVGFSGGQSQNPTVTFKDSDRLMKTLENTREKYFETIVKIFEMHNFKVNIQ